MIRFTVVLLVALTLTAGLVAASRADGARTSSACTEVLGSEVCTWVVTTGGSVDELGATIPMALIESVPTDVEMVWPPQELASVPLPQEARASLGIDRMGVNWEAHGHPPASFMTGHFDFHFYNLGPDGVDAIDCGDASKPGSLPGGYALPDIDVPGMGAFIGLCVPKMGMHAMPEHEVARTEPFEATMMLGYYGGRPIFFEPMVSRALLLSKADFSLPMPAVEGLPSDVRYPRSFRAEYDEDTDAYRFVFGGFTAE